MQKASGRWLVLTWMAVIVIVWEATSLVGGSSVAQAKDASAATSARDSSEPAAKAMSTAPANAPGSGSTRTAKETAEPMSSSSGAVQNKIDRASLNQLELPTLLKEALKSSPQVIEQTRQVHLSEDDLWRRFVINEPQLQYNTNDDNTEHEWGLSLVLPFPAKPFAMSALDHAKVEAQRAELRARRFETAKLMIQSYIDCAQAQASDEVQFETLSDLKTVFATLRRLYEEGHSTQAEKIGAELQARQAEQDYLAAREKSQVVCRKLVQLIPKLAPSLEESLNADSDVHTVLPDDIDSKLFDDVGETTSDQERAQASIHTAQSTASTAFWTQVPDFTVSATHNHYVFLPGSPNGREYTWNYGVSVTLPLLFPIIESAEVKRLKSQARLDENTAWLAKIQADSDQNDAAKEYKRSRARLQDLRSHDLALAEALVESTYSAYRAGKLGYAELVLSRKTLSDLKNQDILLRASVSSAHLRCLNRCNGMTQ